MKHHGLAPIGPNPIVSVNFTPRQVAELARLIAERERLHARDLARCRREIRLQLRHSPITGDVAVDPA